MYIIYEDDYGRFFVESYTSVRMGLVSEDRMLWWYERGERKDFYRFDTEREAEEWLAGYEIGEDRVGYGEGFELGV